MNFFGKTKSKTDQQSLLNSDQQNMMKGLADYYTPQIGKYDSQLNTLLSGKPSTNINKDATEDYIRTNIERPMRTNLEERIMPGISEKMGQNFWSTARQGAQQRALTDNENQISTEAGKIRYNDELERRKLMESAAGRSLDALGTLGPESKLLQLLQVRPFENVTTQSYKPGFMDYASAAGKLASNVGSLGKTFKLW